MSFVRATETEPFENEVAEDVALNNALASDPMQQPLATVWTTVVDFSMASAILGSKREISQGMIQRK